MIFCPSCKHFFNHSLLSGHPCPIAGCNGETVHLDDHMFPIMLALEEKGYLPLGGSSGNFWQSSPCTYIELECYPDEVPEAPQGFALVSDADVTIISKSYDEDLSMLELNAQIAEAVRSLSDWVEALEPLEDEA